MRRRIFNVGETTQERRDQLAADFAMASPFPHVILDGVITATPDAILPEFPLQDWDGWTDMGGQAWQRGKKSCADIDSMPGFPARMLREMNEPVFLKFVEDVTGIRALLADPYLEGGGMHLTAPGGKLSSHTDFHWHKELNVFRRINVLVYLNDAWQPGDGGELQLSSKAAPTIPIVEIAPTFGRCVIFQTDDDSPHGVAPVTEGRPPRRSLAVYYYTSSEAGRFSGDAHAHWQEHDATAGLRSNVRLSAYKATVKVSRGMSHIAYSLNPNRG